MLTKLSPTNGPEIAEVRKAMGLTQDHLGLLIAVDAQALNRWENQKSDPRRAALMLINLLYREHLNEGKPIDIRKCIADYITKDLYSAAENPPHPRR